MSRLDRLVVLLETGSTPMIRNTAATQLADVAKLHPDEVLSILSRVYPFLKSKKWETRVAAAKAFGGIVSQAPDWDPNAIKEEEVEEQQQQQQEKQLQEDASITNTDVKTEIPNEIEVKAMIEKKSQHLVTFDEWNLKDILHSGKVLLATGGTEYEQLPDPKNKTLSAESNNDTKRRRTVFTEKLGLHKVKEEPNAASEAVDSNASSRKGSSISAGTTPVPETPSKQQTSATAETPQGSEQKSARMRALARRKAKVARSGSKSGSPSVDFSQSSISRRLDEDGTITEETTSGEKTNDLSNMEITSGENDNKLVIEHKVSAVSPLLQEHSRFEGWVWQFQGVYELLVEDLFNDRWETRHGATMGLRELLKYQASGVARVKGETTETNDLMNAKTLEDLAVRLIFLFAMDRFGDYVSDTVIAPVRENAAQTLAALLLHMPDETVLKTYKVLAQLVDQNMQELEIAVPCWEAKHGGMLGLRYFVSIRTDLLFSHPELLDTTIHIVLQALSDSDEDDVSSVAASTLIPITVEFVKLKLDLVFEIVNVIWKNLTNLKDDLSASIGSVMDLLAKLCSHDEVLQKMKQFAIDNEEYSFKKLIPRLYPFLRHSIINVRKSVLNTLIAFLEIEDVSVKNWIDGKAVRLLFQNLLVEQNPDVLQLSMKVYKKLTEEISTGKYGVMDDIFKGHFSALLSLLMTPIGIARFNFSMDSHLILRPSGGTYEEISGGSSNGKKRKSASTAATAHDELDSHNDQGIPSSEYELRINIDTPMITGDVTLVGYEVLVRSRLEACKAMGLTISHYKGFDNLKKIFTELGKYLNDPHSTPRLLASIVIEEFYASLAQIQETAAIQEKEKSELETYFIGTMIESVNDSSILPSFREFVPTLRGLRTQCLQLFAIFREQGKVEPHKIPTLPVLVQGQVDAGKDAFGIETAEKVINETYFKLLKNLNAITKMTISQSLEDAKHRITMAIAEAHASKEHRSISILSSYSSVLINIAKLPKQLTPYIKSLMDSIKSEESVLFQRRTAKGIASLMLKLNENGKRKAAERVVNNLCAYLCVDTSEVPEFIPNKEILTSVLSLRKEEAKSDPAEIATEQRDIYRAKIERRGAMFSLEEILQVYQGEVFEKVPRLNILMFDALESLNNEIKIEDDKQGQSIVDALELIRSLCSMLDKSLYSVILEKLPKIIEGLKSKYAVFRYSAAKCFATICSLNPTTGFQVLVKQILPMLSNALDLNERQGSIETIYHLSNIMGGNILPYVVFLIVPVLGRMSDANNDVRILATTTFASIIKLVPLEEGIPDPVDMPSELLTGREREREFISQMMDPSKAKPFELPVAINATLRNYQKDGVNWLAFLNKYHLHGILCDDMGLGKTLQTICMVASDHHMRSEEYLRTGSMESRKLPSLIICPPSLTGHWEQEIQQYAPFLSVLVYAGTPTLRAGLRGKLNKVDVVVTSYDVVRNDIEFICPIDFNYCVLDEGHIIKNANTKLTRSIKRVNAEHRLLLSGTPIQNNVLELWSLFDFLMPGFLGTEKAFQEKFAKPIALSRSNKGDKEQEAGALALESLHKQVLPFMLRRLKEEVLSDLPPKIIQDYYCELSNLQKQLYKDFIKKQKGSIEDDLQSDDTKEKKQHIFQKLNYMRKLCNHPSLVLTTQHPQYNDVMKYLKTYNMKITDIEHGPKLLSLRNLLLECGIGGSSSSGVSSNNHNSHGHDNQNGTNVEDIISQHRVLIFCQLKDMLELVAKELFDKHMPSVSYMRLDGSTPAMDRQKVVKTFNEDPSIDVLLLTTKVGGLGLNLTGADTVIFVEHDWNPMNDLQAMDRAHRIGQKKVVNVYRLITKNTLEEKIMGLQKFKMNIASTIVNQQNSGLASMDTNQILDLFNANEGMANGGGEGNEAQEDNDNNNNSNGNATKANGGDVDMIPNEAGLSGQEKSAVNELGELWDESQYEEEYNLDTFIKTLR